MRKLAALSGLALGMLILAAACGGGGGGGLGKIQTPDGQYSITKVELGDRFPPDCLEADCLIGPSDCTSCTAGILDEGYQAVGVWVKPEFEGPAGGLDELRLQEEGIYIVGDDGPRSPCIAIAWYRGTEEQTLLFTTRASSGGFTLYVADNPPVALTSGAGGGAPTMEPTPTATSEEPTAAPTPTATATIPTPTPSLNPQPGTTFSGPLQPAGAISGTITFSVSSMGDEVVGLVLDLTLNNPPCQGGTIQGGVRLERNVAMPIVEAAFGLEEETVKLSAAFESPTSASGTVSGRIGGALPVGDITCDFGPLAWTATAQ